jgi:hypothetical protein
LTRLNLRAIPFWSVAIVVAAWCADPARVDAADDAAAPKDLHIYLLIGQSNMAGRAKVPDDAAGVLERCYLLNDKNQWEPARNPLNRYSTISKGIKMQRLGPGYSFAKKMLEQNKDIKIGLVVNARGGSKHRAMAWQEQVLLGHPWPREDCEAVGHDQGRALAPGRKQQQQAG